MRRTIRQPSRLAALSRPLGARFSPSPLAPPTLRAPRGTASRSRPTTPRRPAPRSRRSTPEATRPTARSPRRWCWAWSDRTRAGSAGAGFALVYVAKEKRAYAIDFREAAPGEVSTDGIVARARRTKNRRARREPSACRASRRGSSGSRKGSRGARSRPTPHRRSRLARDGFAASRTVLRSVDWAHEEIATSPEPCDAISPPRGRHDSVRSDREASGARGRRSRASAPKGRSRSMKGTSRRRSSKAASAVGGTLTAADLAGYRAKERDPLVANHRRADRGHVPRALGRGVDAARDAHDVRRVAHVEPRADGLRVERVPPHASRRGCVARSPTARASRGTRTSSPGRGRPTSAPSTLQQLAARRARIEPNRTHAAPEFRLREQGTSHVVVADREGNVVSLTTTVNEAFGSRVVAGDTGILLNDELDDFSAPRT